MSLLKPITHKWIDFCIQHKTIQQDVRRLTTGSDIGSTCFISIKHQPSEEEKRSSRMSCTIKHQSSILSSEVAIRA